MTISKALSDSLEASLPDVRESILIDIKIRPPLLPEAPGAPKSAEGQPGWAYATLDQMVQHKYQAGTARRRSSAKAKSDLKDFDNLLCAGGRKWEDVGISVTEVDLKKILEVFKEESDEDVKWRNIWRSRAGGF